MGATLIAEYRDAGFVWMRSALTESELAALDDVCTIEARPGARLPLGSAAHAVDAVDAHIRNAIGFYRAVRVVAFNKTDTANWGVPWHQDRIIPVAARQDVEGYGSWSRKGDVWHCEPPAAILEAMAFVRVHLDDADAQSGPMEIARGSHRLGVIAAADADRVASAFPIESCLARRGDILILQMLTLHRSRPAIVPRSRRALRIDYTAVELAPPLTFAS